MRPVFTLLFLSCGEKGRKRLADPTSNTTEVFGPSQSSLEAHLCNPDPRKKPLEVVILEAVQGDSQEATLALASG